MKVNGINNLLIKVKSVFNRNKISMSTPNINGISVPEFDELSKENQELVLTLIKDIDIDNHESTVKYSEDLAKRTDKYLSILYKVMSEMDESFVFLQKVKEAWAQKKTVNYQLIANRMGDISLLENEAELLIREIAWNDMIATMKTVAFKEFMKNESKKRNIFTMLSKAERMKYHDNNNRLLSEYNRLLNSIYIIRCNMNAASMVSNVTFYNSIIKEMIPGTFGTYHNWYIDEKREKLNKLNDIFGNEKILPPSESELSYESYPGWSMNGFGMLEYNGYVYKTIIKKMAKYKLELDKLGYEHRMDYKDIIERIKEACSRYRGKGSWRWDLDQLEKDKTTFDKIVNDYLSACGKFINDGMKEELIDAWSELLSYYKCISSHNYHEPGYSWDNYDRNKIYNDKLGKILDELALCSALP